jgi:DNA-binding response OmpR family regulator
MTGEILVADDDADLRSLVGMKLAMEGLSSLSVPGGAEALAVLETTPVSLVILDVGMPGMDGIETCLRIRRTPALHAVPVLMLTARARPEEIRRGLAAGATAYMVKPFSPRELTVRVLELLTHASAA